MTNRRAIFLDEPLTPQIGSMIRGGVTVIGVYMLAAVIAMAGCENDPEVLALLAGLTVISVGGLLLLWRLCSLERLIIDEEGVHTRSLMGKVSALPWDSIRTAAVVPLSSNPLHRWIVLSAGADPAQVLVRKRLIRGKAYTSQEMRLPYGMKRLALIEQQLHMKLPEIRL